MKSEFNQAIANKSVAVIPWSGGLDSTFSVFEALSAGKVVIAPYMKLLNNEHKTVVEQKVRENLIKDNPILKQAVENKKLLIPTAVVSFNIDTPKYSDTGHDFSIQTYLWMTMLPLALNEFDLRKSDVEFIYSFVKDDNCSVYATKQVRRILLTNLSDTHGSTKRFKVRFPLMNKSKKEISKELHKKYKVDLNGVWSCENPRKNILEGDKESIDVYEPCGHCGACCDRSDAKFVLMGPTVKIPVKK